MSWLTRITGAPHRPAPVTRKSLELRGEDMLFPSPGDTLPPALKAPYWEFSQRLHMIYPPNIAVKTDAFWQSYLGTGKNLLHPQGRPTKYERETNTLYIPQYLYSAIIAGEEASIAAFKNGLCDAAAYRHRFEPEQPADRYDILRAGGYAPESKTHIHRSADTMADRLAALYTEGCRGLMPNERPRVALVKSNNGAHYVRANANTIYLSHADAAAIESGDRKATDAFTAALAECNPSRDEHPPISRREALKQVIGVPSARER